MTMNLPEKLFDTMVFDRKVLEPPPKWNLGQIWSTKLATSDESDDMLPRLVVLLDQKAHEIDFGFLTVAPISLDLEFATENDLLVKGSDSPLGYDFMVELWNYTTMLTLDLDRYFGELSQQFKNFLVPLWKSVDGSTLRLSDLRAFVGNRVPQEGNDVFFFQESEVSAVEYLERRALQGEFLMPELLVIASDRLLRRSNQDPLGILVRLCKNLTTYQRPNELLRFAKESLGPTSREKNELAEYVRKLRGVVLKMRGNPEIPHVFLNAARGSRSENNL